MRKPALRIVAPFGFYGWGNTGDEATLQGFARLLAGWKRHPRPWVASRNPQHTARVEPRFRYFQDGRETLRKRWAIKWANTFVFAGGTPVSDGLGPWPLDVVEMLVKEAEVRGRLVAFVGIGTESLTQPESRRIVAAELAPRVTHWTVRSVRDKERLLSWGVPEERTDVAADMAWSLAAATSAFGERELHALGVSPDRPVIGVNVNNESVILAREPAFFDNVAACLDRIVDDHDANAVFFCSEMRAGAEFDQAAAGLVIERMRHRDRARLFPARYYSPQELMSLIACCRLVISTRYHVCLFSTLQAVPFVALKRSDKVSDLCADIGWPLGLNLGEMTIEALSALAADGLSRQSELGARLVSARRERAQQTLKNRIALDVLANRL